MPQIPFLGSAYEARAKPLDVQRCVNLYPEVDETQNGKTVGALLGTPGLETITVLSGRGPVRGVFAAYSAERVFAVQDNQLFEIYQDGTIEPRGTLQSDMGNVSMAENGLQLCLVDGDNGYIFTFADDSFQRINDPDFRGADFVTFQDGYFIFNEPGGNNFYISALYNGLEYSATDFAAAESNPDPVQMVISHNRVLWVFGPVSTDVFYNSGNPDFPFDRMQGAYLEWGTVAPWTVVRGGSDLYVLGGDRAGNVAVLRISGYQGQRVSTHPIEKAISEQPTGAIQAATAHIYLEEGHEFYILNVGDETWCFDINTGLWHQRARLLPTGQIARARAQWSANLFNLIIVGDFENGSIYRQALDVYTEAGMPIPRIRVAPYIGQDRQWLFPRSFEVDFERGVGLDGTGQGVDPQAVLQWSDDDGRTWSNERWASIGRIGVTQPRVIWRRLGRHRDRAYRVTITDPIKVAMVQAVLE